jgi:uncharacterized protein YacL
VDFVFLIKIRKMPSILSTYTTEELIKKLKKQKMITIVQGFVIFLMVIFAVFYTLEKGVSYQTFLPLFFTPMLFVMFFEIKKIKKELASRK